MRVRVPYAGAAVSIVLIFHLFCNEGSAAVSELTELQASFEKALADVDQQHGRRLSEYVDTYGKTLPQLGQVLSDKGNLDGVLAIRKEKERFARDKSVPAEPEANAIGEVIKLQAAYNKAIAQSETTRNRQIVSLAKQYADRLTGLERDLTVRRRIDDALAVRSEKDGIAKRPEVSAAEFALADAAPGEKQEEKAAAPEPAAVKEEPVTPKKSILGSRIGRLSRDKPPPRLTQKDLEEYRKVIERAWPGLGKGLGLSADGKLGLCLPRGTVVNDLSPLKGIPLSRLNLVEVKGVADLTPLRGMPMGDLNIIGAEVSDLTPLEGMPLTTLHVYNCAGLKDLTPLRGMNLEVLTFSPKHVEAGIEDIRAMKTLKEIGVSWTRIDPKEFWKKFDAGEFGTKAP